MITHIIEADSSLKGSNNVIAFMQMTVIFYEFPTVSLAQHRGIPYIRASTVKSHKRRAIKGYKITKVNQQTVSFLLPLWHYHDKDR